MVSGATVGDALNGLPEDRRGFTVFEPKNGSVVLLSGIASDVDSPAPSYVEDTWIPLRSEQVSVNGVQYVLLVKGLDSDSVWFVVAGNTYGDALKGLPENCLGFTVFEPKTGSRILLSGIGNMVDSPAPSYVNDMWTPLCSERFAANGVDYVTNDKGVVTLSDN